MDSVQFCFVWNSPLLKVFSHAIYGHPELGKLQVLAVPPPVMATPVKVKLEQEPEPHRT